MLFPDEGPAFPHLSLVTAFLLDSTGGECNSHAAVLFPARLGRNPLIVDLSQATNPVFGRQCGELASNYNSFRNSLLDARFGWSVYFYAWVILLSVLTAMGYLSDAIKWLNEQPAGTQGLVLVAVGIAVGLINWLGKIVWSQFRSVSVTRFEQWNKLADAFYNLASRDNNAKLPTAKKR